MDTIAFSFQLEKNEAKDPKNVFEPEYFWNCKLTLMVRFWI